MPILFNGWKHHGGFIRNRMGIFVRERNLKELMLKLKTIGGSVTDFYVGNLSIDQIKHEVFEFLNEQNICGRAEFSRWIQKRKGYQNIQIADNSSWTLMKGEETNQYVHLHPARYSIRTIRIKGNTLKTVIALYYMAKTEHIDPLRIDEINRIRADYLSISPVKHIDNKKGLGRMISFFFDQMDRDPSILLF